MQWNVLRESFNDRKIVSYNIFDHVRFSEDIKKLLREDLTKEEFSERLRREVMYNFWSKSEHEVVVCSWSTYISEDEFKRIRREYEEWIEKYNHPPRCIQVSPVVSKKIDVYDQIRLNWDTFVDYVWSHKDIVKQKKSTRRKNKELQNGNT